MDVCTIGHGTKFRDDKGNDIIPIQLVNVIDNNCAESKEPLATKIFHKEKVSIQDLTLNEIVDDDNGVYGI